MFEKVMIKNLKNGKLKFLNRSKIAINLINLIMLFSDLHYKATEIIKKMLLTIFERKIN